MKGPITHGLPRASTCWTATYRSCHAVTHSSGDRQRYVVEIWIEKSTIDDIVTPPAPPVRRQHRHLHRRILRHPLQELVDRANEHGKPVRIIYLSDFDPGGQSMPVAASRKIEHRLRTDSPDLDIQLRHVLLTHTQCKRYRLPRTPLKKSERRADRFEERFGDGATELDALEAIRPGEMRRNPGEGDRALLRR